MRPEGSNKRTRMEYEDVKFNVKFPANHFTLQNLTDN
jgi:outer membrane lipoprotein-sorting protein